jgi:hypothetical protein
MPRTLSVVLSTKGEVERETGLEPATLSLKASAWKDQTTCSAKDANLVLRQGRF